MSLSEFSLIQRYFIDQAVDRGDVAVGIGDDGAVVQIPNDHALVVSIDTLVSGVHFPHDTSASAIAHKALAVNLSDMAAMAAMPAWATLSLTLPDADEDWLKDFSQAFFRLATIHKVQLIGGDTCRGPLSVTVQMHGFVPKGGAVLRQGASVGDLIVVTGSLGDAAMALGFLQKVSLERPAGFTHLLARLEYPTPRVEVALAIREWITAAIDLSDGLLADLGHLLTASGVGASLDLAAIPLSDEYRQAQQDCDLYDRLSLALSGGDDYELCFTISPNDKAQMQSVLDILGCPYHYIGVIENEKGIRCLMPDGEQVNTDTSGYTHF